MHQPEDNTAQQEEIHAQGNIPGRPRPPSLAHLGQKGDGGAMPATNPTTSENASGAMPGY